MKVLSSNKEINLTNPTNYSHSKC